MRACFITNVLDSYSSRAQRFHEGFFRFIFSQPRNRTEIVVFKIGDQWHDKAKAANTEMWYQGYWRSIFVLFGFNSRYLCDHCKIDSRAPLKISKEFQSMSTYFLKINTQASFAMKIARMSRIRRRKRSRIFFLPIYLKRVRSFNIATNCRSLFCHAPKTTRSQERRSFQSRFISLAQKWFLSGMPLEGDSCDRTYTMIKYERNNSSILERSIISESHNGTKENVEYSSISIVMFFKIV